MRWRRWFPIRCKPGDSKGCMTSKAFAGVVSNSRSINPFVRSGTPGATPLTVNRWIRTSSVDCANPPVSRAGRDGYPTSRPRCVAVEVRQNLTAQSSATATLRDWSRSSPLVDGSCGFHSGLRSVWSASFWPSCPRAELPLEHTGLPRSRGHGFGEVL